MSYKTPTQFKVGTSNTAILLDEKIEEIQTAMDDLSWLTYSFARAYKTYKDMGETRITYPAVYQGDGVDYLNCFPNDNYASHSFVFVRQPQRLISTTQGWNDYEADISIIVFFRLKEISTKGYHFTEELKYDVVEILEDIPELTINEVYDEIEDAYADFTVSAIESEFLTEDTGALRFDCTVKYSNNCEITNIY